MAKPEQEVIKTTLRIPKHLWDKVRIHGIKHGTSAQEIMVTALAEYLKKGGS